MKQLPPYLAKAIHDDNTIFDRDVRFFEPVWLEFLYDFACYQKARWPTGTDYPLIVPDDSSSVGDIRFMTDLFLNFFCRSNEKDLIRRFAILLKGFLHDNLLAARWYLHAMDRSRISTHLRDCTFSEARTAFAATVVHAFRELLPFEEEQLLNVDESDSDSEEEGSDSQGDSEAAIALEEERWRHRQSQASCWRFLRQYYLTVPLIPWSWRVWSQYFLVLRELGLLSETVRRFFLLKDRQNSNSLIHHALELFHGQNMFEHTKFIRTKIGDRYSSPNYQYLTSLAFVIANSCTPPQDEQSEYGLGSKFTSRLAMGVQDQFFHSKFLVGMMRCQAAPEDLTRFLIHWCKNHERRTEQTLSAMWQGIDDAHFSQVKGFVEVLSGLMLYPDRLQEHRTSAAINFLLRSAFQRAQRPDQLSWVKTLLEYFVALRNVNPLVVRLYEKSYTAEHTNWIQNFLKQQSKLQSGFAPLPAALPPPWRPLPDAENIPKQTLDYDLWASL